jgi:hypothetical protein
MTTHPGEKETPEQALRAFSWRFRLGLIVVGVSFPFFGIRAINHHEQGEAGVMLLACIAATLIQVVSAWARKCSLIEKVMDQSKAEDSPKWLSRFFAITRSWKFELGCDALSILLYTISSLIALSLRL